MGRECTKCQLWRVAEDFQPSQWKRPSGWCRDCVKQYHDQLRSEPSYADREREAGRLRDRRRRQDRRERLAQLKLKKGCVDCGYNSHPEALDFDHLPGEEKCRDVSILASSGRWEQVEAEIRKCEVVCANCHRIRTSTRRKLTQNQR